MGDATRGSPIPLQAAIKAHPLCEENAHLRHMQRLIKALQSVTISLLSRACLYPPSKEQPGFTLACAPVLCGFLRTDRGPLSYVVHKTLLITARIRALHRLCSKDRGYGVGELPRELRFNGVLRSSPGPPCEYPAHMETRKRYAIWGMRRVSDAC